jgi:hypothetical protein
MDRRSTLQFGSSVLAGALTGCLGSVNPGPESVSVSDIVVRNRTDSEVELSVLLSENKNILYWQSVTVPAQPNPFATLDNLPDRPGAYELYARILSSNGSSPVSADLTEEVEGQSCIEIGLEITHVAEDGEDIPAVVFGTISEC